MAVDTQDEPREQAVAYLKRKRKLYADAVSYATVNGALWVIWALTGHSTGGGGVPWPVWVSAIWGFFLAMDVFKVYGPVARRIHAPISEAEIQRQVDRSARGAT